MLGLVFELKILQIDIFVSPVSRPLYSKFGQAVAVTVTGFEELEILLYCFSISRRGWQASLRYRKHSVTACSVTRTK